MSEVWVWGERRERWGERGQGERRKESEKQFQTRETARSGSPQSLQNVIRNMGLILRTEWEILGGSNKQGNTVNNMVQRNSLGFYLGTGVTSQSGTRLPFFLLCSHVYAFLGNHLRKRTQVLTPSAYYPLITLVLPIGIQAE